MNAAEKALLCKIESEIQMGNQKSPGCVYTFTDYFRGPIDRFITGSGENVPGAYLDSMKWGPENLCWVRG